MKIGIVTVPDSANFGSFLQAYALETVLKSWGNDVVFIRTREKEYLKKLYVNWRPRKYDLIHFVQFIKKNLNGIKKREQFIKAQSYFNICDLCKSGEIALFLLGSDEIWNVCTKVFQNPLFFGHGMNPVVAYAVSSGRAKWENFIKYPELVKDISSLNDIYVRDKNTMEVVEKFTHRTPGMVCDPTFLVEGTLWEKKYENAYLKDHKYLAIYIYPGVLTKNVINVIKAYAKVKGLKLVSVGFWNGWCDYNVVCGPLEFPSVLENADCVITGTFHGTIFSVLKQKSFISIATSNKIIELLEQIGLTERFVAQKDVSISFLEKKLLQEVIDYEKTMCRINKMKKESLLILKGVIDKYAKSDL